MTGFMRQLRAFAQIFSMTVFVRRLRSLILHDYLTIRQVVNNSAAFTPFVAGSVSNNPNIRKPALGPSFTFLTDATLWLALCGDDTDLHERNVGIECTKHVAQVYRSKITVCFFISIRVPIQANMALRDIESVASLQNSTRRSL
jgi:hypothetical protein